MATKRMGSSELFEQALAAEGITGTLADAARSIYFQESSGGKNTQTSNAGAVGGMQIRPRTFGEVADKGWDINNPMHNARAGIRYLAKMFERGGGDPAMAAIGYYGGPGAQEKAKQGIAVADPRNPNAPNTFQYAQQVVGRLVGDASPKVYQATNADVPHNDPDPGPALVASDITNRWASESTPNQQALAQLGNEDPWNIFLNKMRAKQPVTAASIDYANPLTLANAAPVAPVAVQAPRPTMMMAFSDWLGGQ